MSPSSAANYSGYQASQTLSVATFYTRCSVSLSSLRSSLLLASALGIAWGGGWWFGQREVALKWQRYQPEVVIVNKAVPPQRRDVDFSLFWEVWSALEREYLDNEDFDKEKLIYGAISGMTSALGDPYTVFLPPVEQEEAKADLAGTFEGVGIQLGYKDNRLAVIAPLDGTPAKAAGVEPGDLILSIKDSAKSVDTDTEGMTLPQAVEIIRGPRGSAVVLTLFRPAKNPPQGEAEPFEVTLRRDTILVKSATVEMVPVAGDENQQIAYVRMSRFGDRTMVEWNEVAEQVIKADNPGAKVVGMVLDLRNNPGGYLEAAVKVASEFFADGIVVEQKGKRTSKQFTVDTPGRLTSLPLVVLVNQGSASASEIVAGAIQARERGKLVGTNTFGKGTVQDAQELRQGAGLHVTVARWLLPNGNWIHEEGLKPDIEVEFDRDGNEGEKWDNQVKMAFEILTGGENI